MWSTFALMFSKIYHVVEKTVANLSKTFIDLLRLLRWSNFCGDAKAMVFFRSDAIPMFFGHTTGHAIIWTSPSLTIFSMFCFYLHIFMLVFIIFLGIVMFFFHGFWLVFMFFMVLSLPSCHQAVSNINIKISYEISNLQVDIINSQSQFTQVSPALCEVVPE